MNKTDLIVPDIGGFENVEVIEVHVSVGDSLQQEDAIITLESDKATMDIPSPVAGKISELTVKVGDKVSEGSRLGAIETSEAGEAAAASEAETDTPAPAEASEPASEPVAETS